MENRKATEAGQDVTMQKEDFAALWKTIHLKVTDTYEVPPEMLWVNGSTIGTLGNFSASTGKAKSKKTFNISAIVAAALKNDEVLKYSVCLPPNKRKILYVDTEQSKYHCHKVMERNFAPCRTAYRQGYGRFYFHRVEGADPRQTEADNRLYA